MTTRTGCCVALGVIAPCLAFFAFLFLREGKPEENVTDGAETRPTPQSQPSVPPAPAPSPSREIVKTFTLKPGEWSEWVELGPSTRWTVDWKTHDRKIEYEVWRMGESRPETMAAEYGKPSDMGTYIEKFRCRHPKKGTVTVTIKPF